MPKNKKKKTKSKKIALFSFIGIIILVIILAGGLAIYNFAKEDTSDGTTDNGNDDGTTDNGGSDDGEDNGDIEKTINFRTTSLTYGANSIAYSENCGDKLTAMGISSSTNTLYGDNCEVFTGLNEASISFMAPCKWDDCKAYILSYYPMTIEVCSEKGDFDAIYSSNKISNIDTSSKSINPEFEILC